jgi:dinuclear metal center YbgI/SA1388 family protein
VTDATAGDVIAALDELYDPRWAEPWDAVGTVCGDPDQPVRRVLFAVDPVAATAREAIDGGFDLLVTHHPLLLTPVHGVAATSAKGRVVHDLIRAGVALHVCHTNADVASPGVSDALAAALGLTDLQPLAPTAADPQDKLVVFVPADAAEAVLDALAAAGAGTIGDYTRCAWRSSGEGTFVTGASAHPVVGSPGSVERVPEERLEVVLPRARRAGVVRALLAAHPYEEPAYDVYERALLSGTRGLGRVGTLPTPMPAAEFVRHVARSLPATAAGVRGTGDPNRVVHKVAVCGGSGDGLIADARRAGVDAFVTADLRHHRTSEAIEDGGPVLVEAAHWATEWPWLADAAERLRATLQARGITVTTSVSAQVTDPWRLHVKEIE